MDRSENVAVFPVYGTGDPIFDLSAVREAIAAGDRAGFKRGAKQITLREYQDGNNSKDLVDAMRGSGMPVAFVSPIADVYLRILLSVNNLEADFRAAGVNGQTFGAGLTAVMKQYPDARRVCLFAGGPGALGEVMRRRAEGERRLMTFVRSSPEAGSHPSWAPDVTWNSATELLRGEVFDSLRYFGELESLGATVAADDWHPGSVIRHASEQLYSLGRYFAKGRMSELHAAHKHSQRILSQKQTSSPLFEASFTEFLKRLAGAAGIDLVWSVPCRAWGSEHFSSDRLEWYRHTATRVLGAEECTSIREANPLGEPLKGLGYQGRLSANSNRFVAEGDLAGKTLLLIDDVWTTGSTLNAVSEVAHAAGAERVIKVVFGINQVEPLPHRGGWY